MGKLRQNPGAFDANGKHSEQLHRSGHKKGTYAIA